MACKQALLIKSLPIFTSHIHICKQWSYELTTLAITMPCQVRARAARATDSAEEVEARVWVPHHTWAGQELFRIAVDLRGFYLKARAMCSSGCGAAAVDCWRSGLTLQFWLI